jgi:hypothetical protein
VAVAISKGRPSNDRHPFAAATGEFLAPAFPHSGRKNTDAGNSHSAARGTIKRKKPGTAGLSDEFHFQSAHFASLAI